MGTNCRRGTTFCRANGAKKLMTVLCEDVRLEVGSDSASVYEQDLFREDWRAMSKGRPAQTETFDRCDTGLKSARKLGSSYEFCPGTCAAISGGEWKRCEKTWRAT